jgi:tetratricopeptide (TPR) repeat protein
MKFRSTLQRVAQGLLLAACLNAGLAMAQSEPTLNQVYAAAQAGKLDDAQLMIQQVLISHPKSAKAHFVRAELFARQGDAARAREALATADKLSPGLAFAKPEAVQALRTQLATKSTPQTGSSLTGNRAAGNAVAHAAPVVAAPVQAASSSSWGLPLLLVGGVLVAGYFIFRRRATQPAAQQPAYAGAGGLSGPQSFGMGGATVGAGAMQPGYPQQGGYAQQPGTGLGGRIMGGVATGLAVGAGVMAAQAIGRTLMGDHNANAGQLDNGSRNDYQPIANSNPDMGGADFGVNDAGSWDDGGGTDAGGDWDN